MGDVQTACADGAALRSVSPPNDPYPTKLQVFCQFAAGKGNEAGLGLDLLREQKVSDPAFFAAAESLSGIGSGKLGDSLNNQSALTIAMARAAKLAIPESAVTNAKQAAIWRGIAQSPSASLEARLAATEKAEAVGAVDTDVLRQLYESMTFSQEELVAPVADKTARGKALLYRAALQQGSPTAKAEIIAKALNQTGDGYFTAARLYAPQLAGLKPAVEFISSAPAITRALFAVGNLEAARSWLGFLRGQGLTNNDTANSAMGFWALSRLTTPEGDAPIPAGVLAAWRKSRLDLPAELASRRLAVGYSLLTAFGEKIPSDDWLPLYEGPLSSAGSHPRPALWQGLRSATEDLRLGETVMLSLVTLGDGGLAQGDPTDLYRVVAALRLLGLEADARALALEAAIANGV